jgi:hypothetical protein
MPVTDWISVTFTYALAAAAYEIRDEATSAYPMRELATSAYEMRDDATFAKVGNAEAAAPYDTYAEETSKNDVRELATAANVGYALAAAVSDRYADPTLVICVSTYALLVRSPEPVGAVGWITFDVLLTIRFAAPSL